MISPIRFFDLRDGGAVRLAQEEAQRARDLRDDCLRFFPPALRFVLPLIDRLARVWLQRSRAPYLVEIAAIASHLGFDGVWFLNGSYQWGCTACAADDPAGPWLVRTLDWPFPGLGRHVAVTWQSGQAGDFYNVTWPGYVGTLTAMAPGRFAASINQAPLFRRNHSPWLRPYDLFANALSTWRITSIPPDQLLRQIFETCATFGDARRMLETTPVARPVIYTLAGCKAGERCVIERTEHSFRTRMQDSVAANDWLHNDPAWEGRIGPDKMFKSSYQDARENSVNRREGLAGYAGAWDGSFAWLRDPVLNRYTRLAVEMCPAAGILRVVGYDNIAAHELPVPVTEKFELAKVLPAT